MTVRRTFERRNPLTGEVATTAPATTATEANAICDKAAMAFTAWAALGPNARRALLNKAAVALEARADAFIGAMSVKSARPKVGPDST